MPSSSSASSGGGSGGAPIFGIVAGAGLLAAPTLIGIIRPARAPLRAAIVSLTGSPG